MNPGTRARRPGQPQIALGSVGRLTLMTSAVGALAGILAHLPPLTALSLTPLLGVLFAYAHARSTASGQLAALEIDPSLRTLRTTVGDPATFDLRLRALRGGPRLSTLSLAPRHSPGIQVDLTRSPAQSLRLTARPSRIGDGWIYGLTLSAEIAHGLFHVRRWRPLKLRLTAVPAAFPLSSTPDLPTTRLSPQARRQSPLGRRRGFGLELRELRDHIPGDPFKHIAWRATARRGKLISREFESELTLRAWIAIDASPSMFWGSHGHARIDFALETAYTLASTLLARGDRVGLIVFDDRVLMEFKPGRGRRQLLAILEGLLQVPHLYHEHRTELTRRDLVERVGRWIESQRGISTRLPPTLIQRRGPSTLEYDEARIADVVRQTLREIAEERPRATIPVAAYAADPADAALRAFCRHEGIALPLDPTPVPGGQARGLERCVNAIALGSKSAETIVAISDLYTTAEAPQSLHRVAAAIRRRRQSLSILCPADPAFEGTQGPAESALHEAVAAADRLRVQQQLAVPEAALRAAGASLIRCAPEEALPRLLERLRRVA